ncbi:MAG TPA: S8 family serine peptidase, partial [Chitinophagales bacterium]|nr:S8 family serine peptidase [Chitinophagales bacterium]
TEWTAANINAGTCTHVPPPGDFGHGTCVTGIAAGNGHSVYGTPHQGKYTGIAPEADIIAVRVRNGNNFFASVVDAVDYIFKKADSLGKPCVINTSIGDYWGSHDGLDLTSQAIDNLITAKNGRALVAAAGNGGNVPFHLSYPIQPDSTYTYFKRIAPYDEAYFDFWADTANFKNAFFAIGLHSASGAYKGRTAYFSIPTDFNPTPGNDVFPVYDVLDLNGNFQGTVFMRVALDGSRYQVEIATDYMQTLSDLWTLQMKGAGTFDLWASQAFTGSSDMTSSTSLGPITNPIYRHPDNYKTMVTSWQNSDKVITVGNYSNRASYVDYNSNTVNLLGSPYFETVGQRFATSSLGPTRDNRVKPDVMATGSTTICTGDAVYISGLLSNSQPEKVSVTGKHVRNGGTSMASPVVAGIVALYLEQNPSASYSEIKEALICTAKQDAFTGAVPNREYGNGKVNAFAAITRPCVPIIYGSLDTGCLNYNPLSNTDTGCVAKVYGVMDTACLNYNPLANVSGGVCIPKVYGVMDTACINYNPLANVSGGVCSPKVYGVMDTTCLNYNPLANVSGGVCTPKVYGVMDTACLNYNPLANVSGGVCSPKVYGVMDTACLNYNPLANVSGGVCVPKVYGITDTACMNYNPLANVSSGVCNPKVYGVMDTACLNYNPLANVSGGICVPKVYGITDTACLNYNPLANVSSGVCTPKVYGVMDTACLNYNPLANVSGGVCSPKVYGVMDTACINYNPLANVDGGTCTPKVYGITDTSCLNYNPLANVSGGVCNPKIYGVMDTACVNYNPLANISGGVCVPKVYGITDTSCLNYNPLANVSSGVCTPKVYGVMDTACLNYNPLANVSGGVCTPKVYGVMDTSCINYNPLANVDGGTCTPKVYGITDTSCLNYNPLANVSGGVCTPKVYGIMDTSCFNYNPQANIDNGICVAKVYGVTDTGCVNYNALANVDNGACVAKIYGVMDTSCINYSPIANTDNGACVAKVYGVTDTSCINYSAAANVDNGACVAKIYGSMDSTCANYNPLANVDNGCLTSVNDVAFDKVSVQVMPNPFNEQTMFVIDGLQFKTGSIRIYNQLGALIDEFALTSGQYQYNYRNILLAKAIYNYLLVADGKNIKAGKLVVE